MKALAQNGVVYRQLTDEQLINLILSGRQQAYTVLVHRHERLLRFVLQRYLSDPEAVKEVIQDTFVRAFRSISSFRGESKFSTWISKIAVSIAINRLRVRRYAAWDSLENAPSQHWDNAADGGSQLEQEEASQLLRQALRQLSPQDATALDLFYFREQSIEEIGQLTGWTTSNIKSRLSRARQRLRSVLTTEGMQYEYHS